jgi:hypothetical protein
VKRSVSRMAYAPQVGATGIELIQEEIKKYDGNGM